MQDPLFTLSFEAPNNRARDVSVPELEVDVIRILLSFEHVGGVPFARPLMQQAGNAFLCNPQYRYKPIARLLTDFERHRATARDLTEQLEEEDMLRGKRMALERALERISVPQYDLPHNTLRLSVDTGAKDCMIRFTQVDGFELFGAVTEDRQFQRRLRNKLNDLMNKYFGGRISISQILIRRSGEEGKQDDRSAHNNGGRAVRRRHSAIF